MSECVSQCVRVCIRWREREKNIVREALNMSICASEGLRGTSRRVTAKRRMKVTTLKETVSLTLSRLNQCGAMFQVLGNWEGESGCHPELKRSNAIWVFPHFSLPFFAGSIPLSFCLLLGNCYQAYFLTSSFFRLGNYIKSTLGEKHTKVFLVVLILV